MDNTGLELREATIEDQTAINALCEDIWPDRAPDYLPRIYHGFKGLTNKHWWPKRTVNVEESLNVSF